jgi:hypothetical protein
MNAIREQIKNPLVLAIVGFVVGTLFGLIVLGWWLWPVKWINATSMELSHEQKVEYMRMSIEAYGYNGNATEAQTRFNSLGDEKDKALKEIVQSPSGLSQDLILAYSTVVTGKPATAATPGGPTKPVALTTPGAQITQVSPGTPAGQATQAPQATPTKPAKTRSILTTLVPILCLLVLIIAAVLVYIFIIRGRLSFGPKTGTPIQEAEEAKRQAAWTDYTSTGAEPPVAQFMASYKIGDDLFDDSFSIDSASGEFLGECGVGISETIGVGDPKKVTAFEVWLFDKNDIQTVTKVLMSSHAFQDNAIRQRLEAKGEPVLAAPGSETVLETQTLQLAARVVNMGYGDGALPQDSFFDHLVLELAIWQK